MTPASLPENLAERAEWEYPLINSGTVSRALDVGYKNGIVPIISDTTGADIELTLPTPTRAGVELMIVIKNLTGNFASKIAAPSSTNKFIWQTTSGNYAAYRTWTPSETGDFLLIRSVPIVISGTATYGWAVIQAVGCSTSYFSAS